MLNADFVAIKVDREERPDVDRVYMTFVQATTGSGGWPMSVWLTPELKPFFGGTYFPPHSKWGRPGFVDILGEIGPRLDGTIARSVDFAAAELFDRLKAVAGADGRTAESTIAGPDALAEAVEQFSAAFDRAPRRLRRRAEISAAVRAAVPAARARAHRQRRAAR